MADKPLPKIVGKRRNQPDLQLIASALIDLVLKEQERDEARNQVTAVEVEVSSEEAA